MEQFARGAVDVIDAATQQDGLHASAGAPDGVCGVGGDGQRRNSSRRALAGGWTSGGKPQPRRVGIGSSDQRCSAAYGLARLPAAQAHNLDREPKHISIDLGSCPGWTLQRAKQDCTEFVRCLSDDEFKQITAASAFVENMLRALRSDCCSHHIKFGVTPLKRQMHQKQNACYSP
jgi:hypothetical protein